MDQVAVTNVSNTPSQAESIGSPEPSKNAIRADIQALRGLAILLVLLYHSRLIPQLKAGYLGVDIFFVVSGYLITGIIQRAILLGRFDIFQFYVRRIKRLLPAAYATFAVTIVLSPLMLSHQEMRDFVWQLLGAVTFTANVALWMQTGYFEGAAQLKPLLHTWSLSIEEQYYMLVPAALMFSSRRLWRIGALLVMSLSLLLCFGLAPTMPGAIFYLLPTRLWELAIGSVGVLLLEGSVLGAYMGSLFWPALAVLAVMPFFPVGAFQPGLGALAVCTATQAVILRNHSGPKRWRLVRGLAWLGDISYSLYLVHWPLLAFAASAWVSPLPVSVRLGLASLAVVLAWAMYRFIEVPARRSAISIKWKQIAMIAIVSVTIVLTGFAANSSGFSTSNKDYRYVRRSNVGLSPACEFDGAFFDPKRECRNSNSPEIMIWGDSYAMHIVDGIVASTRKGVVQATKSTCGPFLGISPVGGDDFHNSAWAMNCLGFNHSVMSYLAHTPSVRTVILSSVFLQYVSGGQLLVETAGAGDAEPIITEGTGSQENALASMRKTIASLRALGKRVVLIAPPPSSGFDIGRCLERQNNHQIIFGADYSDCKISEAHYRLFRAKAMNFLQEVDRRLDVSIIRFDDFLCHAGTCATELQGVFLYRDEGHFSHDGSRALGIEMGLGDRALKEAR